MKEAPYYVWRRNDGYVAASRYKPHDWKGLNGEVTSFEHLGAYEQWSDAVDVIQREKARLSSEEG